MASGRLGSADLSATTNTTLYTVPASTVAMFSVSICNRGTSGVTVRLALCDTSTPGADEYVEYDRTISAGDSFERSGLVLDATKLVVGYASAANVSMVVYGIEEAV